MSRSQWIFPPEHGHHQSTDSDTRRRLLIGGELEARTRLTAVRGFGQLLQRTAQRDPVDTAKVEHLAGYLVEETARLQHLLEQYFEAARLQWDPAALALNSVRLAQLADSVVTAFEQQPDLRQGRRLWIDARDDVQGIWDAHWLREALVALISNALTYSSADSEIRVMMRHENHHALVVIEDLGEGIGAEEQRAIFEPFRRGSAAERTGATGWGLGLFIASQAVLVHGGWFEIESGVGEGSSFRVHLPLVAPAQLSA